MTVIGQRLIDREGVIPAGDDPRETFKDPWTDRLADAPNDVGPPWDEGPHQPVVTVCDVCAAAKLSEQGIMPTTLTPEQLHATCRRPGECACGCERSRSSVCMNCGQVYPPLTEMRLHPDGRVECVDRDSCGARMVERATAPSDLTKPKKASPRPPRAPSAPGPSEPKTPRTPKAATARPCTCRCGELTGGGMYRPGHDSKHLSRLHANVSSAVGDGPSYTAAMAEAMAELPTDALRAKLTKRVGA